MSHPAHHPTTLPPNDSATGRTTAVPSSPTAPAKRRGSLTNIALDTINSEAVDTNTFEGQLEQVITYLKLHHHYHHAYD